MSLTSITGKPTASILKYKVMEFYYITKDNCKEFMIQQKRNDTKGLPKT